MGASNSNLGRCLEDEFCRLAKHGRKYLVLDEVLALRFPPSSWNVDTSHLGVLFVIDSNHDGHFTLEEIIEFTHLLRARSRLYQPYEFQAQMQGYCTLQLWKALSQEGGQQIFLDWMTQLLVQNLPTRSFQQYPGQTYIGRDSIETLYHILNVKETQGMDFQSFLDLLQRAGEEMGTLELSCKQLDNWLPLCVVREFLSSLNHGLLQVMANTYPAHELADVDL